MRRPRVSAVAIVVACALAGCRDVTRFSSRDGSYEGGVVQGSFVRAGVGDTARLCMTLDTDHLEDAPGVLSTSDGRFARTPLRPIPQIWHDPLSTMTFGDGRVQNLVYVATPANEAEDVLVVLSLMQSGRLEVRLLRGAPSATPVATDAGLFGRAPPLFAVFTLDRRGEPCGP